MKKFLPALLALALPLATPAGDTPNLMGKVMSDATVHACVQTAKLAHPGLDTVLQSQTISTCLVSGSLDRVTIYQIGRCPPQDEILCKPIAVLVATVDLGCEGEIVEATCYVD